MSFLKKVICYRYLPVYMMIIIILFSLVFVNGSERKELVKEDVFESSVEVENTEVTFKNHKNFKFKPLNVELDKGIQEFIFYISESYEIDFTLIIALIEYESNFNPKVISKTGDYGLMQINKMNHKWLGRTLGINDFTDPYDNVRAGIYILRNLFDKYGNYPHSVLMAYNLGESGAYKLWDKGIGETNYTIKIMKRAEELKKELKNGE